MKVLLVSASVSNRMQNELFARYGISAGFAIQKYYRLLEEGLVLNGVCVEALSIVPIKKSEAPFRYRRFGKEQERNVTYRYLPYLRFAPLYHFLIVFTLLFKVFWWSVRNRKDAFVLCDILIPSVGIGTALGAALGRIKRIAWVTDMPGIQAGGHGTFDSMGLLGRIHVRAVRSYSAFVFATAQCNGKLNLHGRPYAVIEGFVSDGTKVPDVTGTGDLKVVMYAGWLVEGYGLAALCEAASLLEGRDDIRFVFYGKGPFEPALREYMARDPRIEYRGPAPNDVIVQAEQSATLLVNPRFTGAEYTLYSYPSKNIEYMVSGTPLVTTRLAGIPKDHYPYIFTFDDETPQGFAKTLEAILSKPREELKEFGRRAAEFIISTRSAGVQVKRILDLLKD